MLSLIRKIYYSIQESSNKTHLTLDEQTQQQKNKMILDLSRIACKKIYAKQISEDLIYLYKEYKRHLKEASSIKTQIYERLVNV